MSYAVDFDGTFTDLLSRVINVAVRVVIFLAIIALGWLVARWIRRLLGKLLHKIGFDRAAQRGGLDRMLGQRTASDLTAQLVMYTFLLFVLQLAFGIFGPNPVSDLIARFIGWLPQLFIAVVIVVVAAAIAGWVKETISGVLGGVSYGPAIATAAQVAIIALGAFAALGQIGIATSVITPVLWAFLATIAGILVVGLGGGLVKPMQHRWERMLNRAENETSIAAERIRSNRAAQAGPEAGYGGRDMNQPGGFAQPAYGGAMPSDVQQPPTAPTRGQAAPTRGQAPAEYEYENQEFYEDRQR